MLCFSERSWANDAEVAHINWTLLVWFLEHLGTLQFKVSLKSGSLDVKQFLKWAHTSTAVPEMEIVVVLTEKRHSRTSEQFTRFLP